MSRTDRHFTGPPDAYEQLGERMSKPSVKQHLAAIRMLFDYLVIGQVVPFNPAAAVRGPKYVLKTGKTPVLNRDEVRQLFEAIDISTIAGLRDRALMGVLVYTFARIGAAVQMDVGDYYQQGSAGGCDFTRRAGRIMLYRYIIRLRNSWTPISSRAEWPVIHALLSSGQWIVTGNFPRSD
jgi:integrase